MSVEGTYQNKNLSVRDKIKFLDLQLIILILILGLVSFLVMFSIDGGKFGYYTNNHIIRFSIFFLSTSTHVTLFPTLEKQVPVTSPTYPVPIMAIFIIYLDS